MSTPDRLRFNAAALIHEYTQDSKGPSCTLQDMSPVSRSKATMLLACNTWMLAILQFDVQTQMQNLQLNCVRRSWHALQTLVAQAMADNRQGGGAHSAQLGCI